MVYTKRNNYDCYEIDCIHSATKNRRTKKLKAPNDIGLPQNKYMENSYSTESLHTKCSSPSFYGRSRLTKKKTDKQIKPLNRSEQNLCYYSANELISRCDTPLRKGKKMVFDSANIDFLNIPESDRRILEILALKKEREIQSESFAHQSQLLWEKSQNERIKSENEQKQRWQMYVKDKRKSDSLHNLFRMEDIKQNLRASQIKLEESLQKRDTKIALLKKKCEEKKQSEIKEKHDQATLKKAIIIANYKHKEDEIEELFQKHIGELEEKLNKAESVRRVRQEQTHKRVASANRFEDLRHQENMLELLVEQSYTQQKQCYERESRARERQIHYKHKREKSIKQLRAEQEEKAAQVREMHRELMRGLEAWQDQVLLLQWADHQRAEAAVMSQREHRRLKVEVENKERHLLHEQRMKKVREAEQIKQQTVRETINAKEQKIISLQRQRERELLEGRAQAQMTAELREHLRRTLSPETFDRKVARAAIETRITYRPMTASPSLLSSHIRLG